MINPPKSQIDAISDKQCAEQMQKKALEQQSEAIQKTVKRSASRNRQTPMKVFAKSAMRSVGSQIGRRVVRGILGPLVGRK